MKIRKINILLALSFAIIAFSGCEKDDGAIPERVTVTEVPVITTNIDATGSQSINLLNLASFAGKFKVDLYFPGATPPSKVDIVVRKSSGTTVTNANVRVYKTGITTLPATFTVTAAEIAALFGVPIALGDNYDFAPDFYVGDRKFQAFPSVGVGTGAGVIGQPLYGEFARYTAICLYDPAIYEGDFEVVQDQWADYAVGDIIRLTRVSNNKFSWTNVHAINPTPVPIEVTVNVGNNQVSIPKTVIGTKWDWAGVGGNPNYTGAYVQTTGAATASFVSPCSKTVTLNMLYGVDPGTYSPYLLVLRKKP